MELRAPVAEMRRQAERMTTIIRDLLALSRLEETDEVVAAEPMDVAALMAMLRKDVLARAEHPHEVNMRVDSVAQLLGTNPKCTRRSPIWSTTLPNTPRRSGSIGMRWWSDATARIFR